LQATSANDRALASRDLKTVALMRLMMVAGAQARGAERETIEALAGFGERFGRVYQICDDLLDELGERALSGKTPRQDARHLRPSAVSVLGAGASESLAVALAREGASLLTGKFGARGEACVLIEAAEMLLRKVNSVGAEQIPVS
jgi:geranylgeranyl pyrophosphate synthase